LQNLLKIGQLADHETDKKQVGKLLAAAARCMEDARQESISPEVKNDPGQCVDRIEAAVREQWR
jgi:hypothetical protein